METNQNVWKYERNCPSTIITQTSSVNLWSGLSGRWCGLILLPKIFRYRDNIRQAKNCQISKDSIALGDETGKILFVNLPKVFQQQSDSNNNKRKSPSSLIAKRFHKKEIYSISSTYSVTRKNDKFIVSGGVENRICLINLNEDRKIVREFADHTETIEEVLFFRDCRKFASCSLDRTIKIFDIEKSKSIYTYTLGTKWVNGLNFLNDFFNFPVMFSCSDESVNLYDNREYKVVHKIEYGFNKSITAIAAVTQSNFIIAGDDNGDLYCTDLRKMNEFLWEKKIHSQRITRIQQNDCEDYEGFKCNSVITCSKDTFIKIVDSNSGKVKKRMKERRECYDLFLFRNENFRPNRVLPLMKKICTDLYQKKNLFKKVLTEKKLMKKTKLFDCSYFSPHSVLINEEKMSLEVTKRMFKKMMSVVNVKKVIKNVKTCCTNFLYQQSIIWNDIKGSLNTFFGKSRDDLFYVIQKIEDMEKIEVLTERVNKIMFGFVNVKDLINILKYACDVIGQKTLSGDIKENQNKLLNSVKKGSGRRSSRRSSRFSLRKSNMFTVTQNIYVGEFDASNTPTGYGYIISELGNSLYNLTYKGQVENGEKSGVGIAYDTILAGKMLYEGEFKKDKKSGIGVNYEYERQVCRSGKFDDGYIIEENSHCNFGHLTYEEIEKKINQKNFVREKINSTVYQVKWIIDKCNVEIYNLPKNPFLKDKIRTTMRKNLRDLSNIEHPNIQKIIGVVDGIDVVGLVSKDIPLKTLQDAILEKQKLVSTDKLKILYELAGAIEHLHNNNFILRNLSLDSILIDEENSRKVVLSNLDCTMKNDGDYWNSGVLDELNSTIKPVFTAPESFTGGYVKESDIYSFGVVRKFFLSF